MRYLLIICHDGSFAPTEDLLSDIHAWIEAMEGRGVRVDGSPLRPSRDAVTVRVRDGARLVTPGPFADSQETMCAYELIEAASREEAVAIALTHPMAKVATIEVRPVWVELTAPAKQPPIPGIA